ncbi:MAG: ATP-binding protein, partial [Lacisediminimonas sp.]|nr:ATP-binding protein [Lacisediminimonas sp.]
MPNFSKLLQSSRQNFYVRIALIVLLTGGALVALLRPIIIQDSTPVVRSQDIAQIMALPANRDRLEYLLLAVPGSDSPRYIFKYRDTPQINVVKVPSVTHSNLEREVLLKNGIPFAIAQEAYLSRHRAVLDDDASKGWLSEVGTFVARNAIGLVMLAFLVFMLKNGRPGMASKATVTKPEQLRGSMDDLIGMEDIKREVAHLEQMIVNRSVYRSHKIDKPFNVMLTGPAGTGKTKLAGYLAKKLNMPLIAVSGSSLESGYVGGGSKALNAIYKKASALGDCIVFLDEAQSLFMPRGRGEKRWEDDTANTLLSLLDGVEKTEGAGVIWVVASNFDDASSEMDDAMLRRFSVKINFRLPNKAERRELLHVFLSRKDDGCVDWNNLKLDDVAEMTANLSPALVQMVVDRASMLAIEETRLIDTDILFRAFERTAIGLTDRATTSEKDKQRERVALHELGHFFMQIDPHLRSGMSLAE